jgi:Uma2 family endonuclease
MPQPAGAVERHTYGEYLTWPEGRRCELIDGVAYAMAPAPGRGHQRLVGELYRQIADALEGDPCEVNLAPFDVRLPETDEADEAVATVVQPDIAVVCDPSKLDERGCRGAPDWIVEVLSPSSAGHDQICKLALYERHGVKEYWLAHPSDRIVTVYRLENHAYGRPLVREMRERLASATCPQVEIDWERVVKGLPRTPGA